MSRYGQTYAEDSNINYFEPGINEDVYLTKFEVEPMKTDKYDGPTLLVEWTKKGSVINARRFPVNESQIKSREVGGQMQSLEEAIDKAYSDLKNWIKHVVTNYNHLLPENQQGKFDEVTSRADSFESLCNLAKTLLPKNTPSIKGQLIVGVNKKNGFMEVPGAMWVTGHFWKVEGSDKKLQVKTKNTTPKGYLNLEAPVQVESKPADAPTQDTDW